MKAKLFVLMLFLTLGLSVNAQVANSEQVAAKKEAVKGAKKEAVKGAKKEAVKGAKKEAVKGATKETVVENTYVDCRDDRAAVKASASKKELKRIEKAAKKAAKNNK